MTKGFPQYTHSARQGELGVNLVAKVVSDAFGWLFRRNHQEHDFGIDGQIELVTDDGAVTGQQIALQIKHGRSFLQEKNRWGYVYRGELKHFNYLSNYPLPVIIVICDPDSKECYWVHFKSDQAQRTETGWKFTIPFGNKLAMSKNVLAALVPPTTDSLTELQAYWDLNKMIAEAPSILFTLDDVDVRTMDTSSPREFFDRLRSTKELAFECQGKIEFSFSGYDLDPRELFEIGEVRAYVALLDAALPELFFFVRTEVPAQTLRTFVFCLSEVSWEDGRSTPDVTRKVSFNTDRLGEFFARHFPALNEMTEWLEMPIEENKRISYAVAECFGFNPAEFGGDA
ncbi:MAG: DUF4365 and DUF1817 domain-containing protein [Acidobacteriota bacterium]